MNLALPSGYPEVDRFNETGTLALAAFERIRHFRTYYPAFDDWFWDRVVPGLYDGTRMIRTVTRNGELSGLTILKKAEERKICTLWIADRFQGTGMGVRLLQDGLRTLGDRPLATVPEERIGQLGPVLDALGFELMDVVTSAYRVGRKEFVFNGYLQPRLS